MGIIYASRGRRRRGRKPFMSKTDRIVEDARQWLQNKVRSSSGILVNFPDGTSMKFDSSFRSSRKQLWKQTECRPGHWSASYVIPILAEKDGKAWAIELMKDSPIPATRLSFYKKVNITPVIIRMLDVLNKKREFDVQPSDCKPAPIFGDRYFQKSSKTKVKPYL